MKPTGSPALPMPFTGRRGGAGRREGCKDASSTATQFQSPSEFSLNASGCPSDTFGGSRRRYRRFYARIHWLRSLDELDDFYHGLLAAAPPLAPKRCPQHEERRRHVSGAGSPLMTCQRARLAAASY